MTPPVLAREMKAQPLAGLPRGLQPPGSTARVTRARLKLFDVIDDQIVAVRLHREIPVHDFRLNKSLVQRPALQILEYGPGLFFRGAVELLVGHLSLAESPLPAKERDLVDERKNMTRRNTDQR